jgi:hypothetical protein
VVCYYGIPEPVTLGPSVEAGGTAGEDRFSELVQLAYSTGGFVFDEPGQYLVRVVYSSEGVLQASNTFPLRVGFPVTKEADRFAPNFFNREVGLTLAFEGSMSPYLSKGLDALTEAAERFTGEPLGVKAATAVAQSVGDDFYRREHRTMVKSHSADPERALALTDPGLEHFQAAGTPSGNLAYRDLVQFRAGLHLAADNASAASAEVETLAKDLSERGANPSVVAEVRELMPPAAGGKTAEKKAAPKTRRAPRK